MFVDRGDFFFGTDFEGVDSWGKRESRALGTFSFMTRDGFDHLDPFSVEAGVDTLDNGLETRLWVVPLLGGIAVRTISRRVPDVDVDQGTTTSRNRRLSTWKLRCGFCVLVKSSRGWLSVDVGE